MDRKREGGEREEEGERDAELSIGREGGGEKERESEGKLGTEERCSQSISVQVQGDSYSLC